MAEITAHEVLVLKPALSQLDYYQTYDRAGNKNHCNPITINGTLVGGFVSSTKLSTAVLVDRLHPVQKNHFDLLEWACNNSGGGVQIIFNQQS